MRFWALLFSLALLLCSSAEADDFGQFRTPLVYKGLTDKERVVELVAPFSFKDSKGKIWTVPTGAQVDGASIPQYLWSVVGSPFTGKYREASVIHDYYCNVKTESWQATHKVFYDGMRANGVEPATANLMYAAVYRFGPRWLSVKDATGKTIVLAGTPLPESKASIDLNELVKRPNIGPDEIRRAVDQALQDGLSLRNNSEPLRDLPTCSIAVEPLRGSSNASVLCELDSNARKLMAKRNLSILATDVRTLLSANDRLLMPQIDKYLKNPTGEGWEAVQRSSEEVLNIVNLTMISLVQYDESLRDKAGSAEESFRTARLRRIVRGRAGLLEENRPGNQRRKVEEMRAWKRVYVELLRNLGQELVALERRLR